MITQRNTQNGKFHLFIFYSFNKDLFTTYNILPTILCTEIRWRPNSFTLRAQSTEETYTENQGFPGGSVIKTSPANAGDKGSVSGLGRSPGGGYGNPLQYSCLGNPMDHSPPGYSVHGIFRARKLEWGAIAFSTIFSILHYIPQRKIVLNLMKF